MMMVNSRKKSLLISVFNQHGLNFVVCMALIVAVVIIYRQTLSFELTASFDSRIVKQLREIVDTHGIGAFKNFSYVISGGQYWTPLTHFFWLFDVWVWGDNTGLYRLLSILFHIANALLLFFLLRAATNALWRSAIVAFLFAIHPVNIEQVVWWSVRGRLIATFFCFISFLFYVHYTRKPSILRYFLVFLFWVIGFAAKPDVVFLPVLFLLFDFWPLQRFMDSHKNPKGFLWLVSEKAPFIVFALALALTGAFFSIYHTNLPWPVIKKTLPLYLPTLINIPVAYIVYLWKAFIPIDLPIIFYHRAPQWSIWLSPFHTGLAALALLLLAAWLLLLAHKRRSPYLVMGGGWFLSATLLYVFIFVGGDWLIVPRFGYIPLIGVFICVAWGGAELVERLQFNKLIVSFIMCCVLVLLMQMSFVHTKNWRDTATSLQYIADLRPACEQTRYMLGKMLFEDGRISKTGKPMETMAASDRLSPETYYYLAITSSRAGASDHAQEFLRRTIALDPDFADAYTLLGELLHDDGKLYEAKQCYLEALRINPSLFVVHNNLATVFANTGEYDAAMVHLKKAIEINPDYETAKKNFQKLLTGFYD